MEEASKIFILKLALEKIASANVDERIAGAQGSGIYSSLTVKECEIFIEHLQDIAIESLKKIQ